MFYCEDLYTLTTKLRNDHFRSCILHENIQLSSIISKQVELIREDFLYLKTLVRLIYKVPEKQENIVIQKCFNFLKKWLDCEANDAKFTYFIIHFNLLSNNEAAIQTSKI